MGGIHVHMVTWFETSVMAIVADEGLIEKRLKNHKR